VIFEGGNLTAITDYAPHSTSVGNVSKIVRDADLVRGQLVPSVASELNP